MSLTVVGRTSLGPTTRWCLNAIVWLLVFGTQGVYCQDTEEATTTTTTTTMVGSVGDYVCAGGYIMDSYCIDFGKLLDNQGVRTLEGPEKHTVHCLVDVSFCANSPFEILQDKADDTEHARWYRASNNDALTTLARSVGTSCSTCKPGGTIRAGFRAEVIGKVTAAAQGDIPPTLDVIDARVLDQGASPCGGKYIYDDLTELTARFGDTSSSTADDKDMEPDDATTPDNDINTSDETSGVQSSPWSMGFLLFVASVYQMLFV